MKYLFILPLKMRGSTTEKQVKIYLHNLFPRWELPQI